MFAIGCKCGLFLLNGQFHDLKYALFNRMVSIMSISTPLSGIILFIKFKPVLLTNTLFEDVFPVWLTISVITSLFSALINNNIRSKAISFALCLYSVSLMMIYKMMYNQQRNHTKYLLLGIQRQFHSSFF